MTNDEVDKAITGLEAGITDHREARAHKLKEAAALIRRLLAERDQVVLARQLDHKELSDQIAHLCQSVTKLAGERDQAKNKALDEAAELLRTRSFEDAMADAMMNTSKWSHAADAVSEACANAILALKTNQEPK